MKIVKNAVTCSLCQSPADLINKTYYQCQKFPGHVGDVLARIFSDCTAPQNTMEAGEQQATSVCQNAADTKVGDE